MAVEDRNCLLYSLSPSNAHYVNFRVSTPYILIEGSESLLFWSALSFHIENQSELCYKKHFLH